MDAVIVIDQERSGEEERVEARVHTGEDGAWAVRHVAALHTALRDMGAKRKGIAREIASRFSELLKCAEIQPDQLRQHGFSPMRGICVFYRMLYPWAEPILPSERDDPNDFHIVAVAAISPGISSESEGQREIAVREFWTMGVRC